MPPDTTPAPPNNTPLPSGPRSRIGLISQGRRAAQNNDVQLMLATIAATRLLPASVALKPGSQGLAPALTELLNRNLRHAVWDGSPDVVRCCLAHGADPAFVHATDLVLAEYEHGQFEPIADALFAHGWDINRRQSRRWGPLMWYVVARPERVQWCLERGASVMAPPPPDGERVTNEWTEVYGWIPQCQNCPLLLEKVASAGSVATFELLRLRGAPMSSRCLHAAVWACSHYGARPKLPEIHVDATEEDPERIARRTRRLQERMAMVRHLVEVRMIDVNAQDGTMPGMYDGCNGTPLSYLVSREAGTGFVEVMEYLLDKGADPDRPALNGRSAMTRGYGTQKAVFLHVLENWRARNG